jgi:hypothetical protein
VVRVKVYVEGANRDSKEEKTRCREAFSKLLERAGFKGRMPAVIACGGRDQTFKDFTTALNQANEGDCPILLVDSEDPVHQTGPDAVWRHLQDRDRWVRPTGAWDEQAHLMATCMETWIVADRATLRDVFGSCFQEERLPPLVMLEDRTRQDVQNALALATQDCGKGREYTKGRRSFQVLAELNPLTLRKHLPHFLRLIETLERLLPPGRHS